MQNGRGLVGTGPTRGKPQFRTVGALLLGLTVAGCVNAGQLANLTETHTPSVAFESFEGAPAELSRRLVQTLETEAANRRIPVTAPASADYRLHGYLATQQKDGAPTVVWALDVHAPDQRRAFRLSGAEKVAGNTGPDLDERTLQKLADAGVRQLSAFLAASPSEAGATPLSRALASLDWPDDWTPESAGIFRILDRAPRAPEAAAEASPPLPPREVRLPPSRPAPADAAGSPGVGY